ncbi:MAG: DUF805 domain-containing protein [Burkholderiales bacterium]
MQLLQEFSPSGRLSRGGFWLRHVTSVPLGFWAVIAAGHTPGAPFDVPVAAALLLLLVSLWARRLHDRGRSAWWLLVVAVPVLGALWLWVECACRGTAAGALRFGPAPGVRADYLMVRQGHV